MAKRGNKIFTDQENTQAYLKAGFLGFTGSGKTLTATLLAVGVAKHTGDKRPIYFIDTETGSDWVRPIVEANGLKLVAAKTRAFVDLLAGVEEARAEASVLIVDSMTHIWREFLAAYQEQKKRKFIQFDDWAVLKPEWARFTDLFVNSPLHMIICGRAGFEYDYETSDSGRKELVKTGVKMKAESEMGYEPSILIEMERDMDLATRKTRRVATVLKDRSTLLDGQQFEYTEDTLKADERGVKGNKVFSDLRPHIDFLILGGQQKGVDTSRTSAELFGDDGDTEGARLRRQKARWIDETEVLFKAYFGTSKDDRRVAREVMLALYGSASWNYVKDSMGAAELQDRYAVLERAIALAEDGDGTQAAAYRADVPTWLRDAENMVAAAATAEIDAAAKAQAEGGQAAKGDAEPPPPSDDDMPMDAPEAEGAAR